MAGLGPSVISIGWVFSVTNRLLGGFFHLLDSASAVDAAAATTAGTSDDGERPATRSGRYGEYDPSPYESG